MGELIPIAELRRARERAAGGRAAVSRAEFYFDLSCPFAYLAAERVERSFREVVWRPAYSAALERRALSDPLAIGRLRRAAEQRAAELRMPLQWPDRFPADVPAAMRVAAYAAEHGHGGAFALAAGRLAFCGGFDLDDLEILTEAAAAAGIGLEETLRAAGDESRDGGIERNARNLLAAGADRLPAVRAGRTLAWGEVPVGQLASVVRARLSASGS